MKKTLIIASAFCAGIFACTTGNESNNTLQNSLFGEWEIIQALGVSTDSAETKPFIHFTDSGYINGNASVNHFFAQYTINGDTITLDQFGATAMMGHSMEIESAIMGALNSCVTVDIKDSILNLKDNAENVVMTMKRSAK